MESVPSLFNVIPIALSVLGPPLTAELTCPITIFSSDIWRFIMLTSPASGPLVTVWLPEESVDVVSVTSVFRVDMTLLYLLMNVFSVVWIALVSGPTVSVTGFAVDCCDPARLSVTPVKTFETVFELLTIGIPSSVKFASRVLVELLTYPALVDVDAVRELITLLVHPTFCSNVPVTSATLMAFVEPVFVL